MHRSLGVGGGLKCFSVSPRPLGTLNLLGLGWGWAKWVFRTNGLGTGLENIKKNTVPIR